MILYKNFHGWSFTLKKMKITSTFTQTSIMTIFFTLFWTTFVLVLRGRTFYSDIASLVTLIYAICFNWSSRKAWPFITIFAPFLLPSFFSGGKRKGQVNNQSRVQKSCLLLDRFNCSHGANIIDTTKVCCSFLLLFSACSFLYLYYTQYSYIEFW